MKRFFVSYTVRGAAEEVVYAATKEEAEKEIYGRLDADDFSIDLDEIHDIDFGIHEMHHVERDGKRMWTTYVRPTDVRVDTP